MSFPEVAYVVAKVARADTSTDPAPLNMTETVVHLKPRDQWRAGMTLDRLRAEMGRAVADARRLEHLDDADHQPDRHADDRHPVGGRGQGLWHRSRAARTTRARGGRRPPRTVPGASNVYPGAGHERPVPEHRRRPRGRGALRHRRRRCPGGDRDRHRRDRPDDHDRRAGSDFRCACGTRPSIAPIRRRWPRSRGARRRRADPARRSWRASSTRAGPR